MGRQRFKQVSTFQWFVEPWCSLVLVLCCFLLFLNSKVSAVIYQDFKPLNVSYCSQALQRCILSFYCRRSKKFQHLLWWLWRYCDGLTSKLTCIVKRKLRDAKTNQSDELKAEIKQPGLPEHLSRARGWSHPWSHDQLMKNFMQNIFSSRTTIFFYFRSFF